MHSLLMIQKKDAQTGACFHTFFIRKFFQNWSFIIAHLDQICLLVVTSKAFVLGYIRGLSFFLGVIVPGVKKFEQESCKKKVEDNTKVPKIQGMRSSLKA